MNDKHDLTIGELAEQSGLTRRALRLYERVGLLTPLRGANNYRRYTEQDVEIARLIHELREGGLSLDTIAALFAVKRSAALPGEKLAASRHLLVQVRHDLRQRRQRIDHALRYVDDQLASIQTHLDHEDAQGEKQP